MGLLIAIVFLAAACDAEQGPAETSLQIPNPHYATINESIVVNAPVEKVWSRVGGFCDITEWMNSPEWGRLQVSAGRRRPRECAFHRE
jgi:hypothetical protein